MTNLEHATQSCKRSLRRHAAGEHHHPVDEMIRMWLTEWQLRGLNAASFTHTMRQYADQLELAKHPDR